MKDSKEHVTLEVKAPIADMVGDDEVLSGSDEIAMTTRSETEDSSDTHEHAASPLECTALECTQEVAKPVSVFPHPNHQWSLRGFDLCYRV